MGVPSTRGARRIVQGPFRAYDIARTHAMRARAPMGRDYSRLTSAFTLRRGREQDYRLARLRRELRPLDERRRLRPERRRDGTLPPARRASDKPIAIACLRLVTRLPERPLRSVPRLRSCIARSTF